jgi:glycosyltransferase involved in cell wall biosynthesis
MSLISQLRMYVDFEHAERFRLLLARLAWWRYLLGESDPVRSIKTLCRIARFSEGPSAEHIALQRRVETEISKRVSTLKDRPVNWSSEIDGWKPGVIEKAVILKRYLGEQERGVVLVSFEYQFARLMGVERLRDFAKRYTLVVAPTWSPPHSIANTLLPAQYPDDYIFTLISNAADIETFRRLSPKWRVVPLYASNWANPDLFRPVPFSEKHIDIIMLANFSRYKRHFELFRALRDMPKDLKVVLIGQPSGGGTGASLREQARSWGVEDRIEVRESVTNQQVIDGLVHAKTSLILSRREGSCVAVCESIFANTPVGLCRDAFVGSRVFINDRSGTLLDRENLGKQLVWFLERAEGYSPRRWALEAGLGCQESTAILNGSLKEAAVAAGQRWTKDIAVHYWNPDPLLLNPNDLDDMRDEYAQVQQRFGLTLGKQGFAPRLETLPRRG